MAEDDQDKSEQATPKKREEARGKGRVAKSREINSAALILGLALGLSALGPAMIYKLRAAMTEGWGSFYIEPMTEIAFKEILLKSIAQGLLIMGPLILLFGVLAILSSVAQHGLLWAAHPIIPDPSRINPLKGLKRLFSLQSLMELGKTLLKFVVVSYISFIIVRGDLPQVLHLMRLEPEQIAASIGSIFIRLIFWAGIAITFLGIVDFLFQRWDFERQLRMSRREVKQEMKDTEGDPYVRARIRSLQRDMTRKKMMEDVPKSDVVITNPTELAIAIKYDQATMDAPKVMAKGAGLIAKRIREIAKEHGIPVLENKPLARTIFKTVEIGHLVPVKLYRAVAEVLAYVYRLRGKTL